MQPIINLPLGYEQHLKNTLSNFVKIVGMNASHY